MGTRNTVIQGCSLHHIAVQTRDWEASLRLYRDVLGMKVALEIELPGRKIVQLDAGHGGRIELLSSAAAGPPASSSPASSAPILHMALSTTDARAAAQHIAKAGYEITDGPRDVDAGDLKATVVFFKGPDGEVIELYQSR